MRKILALLILVSIIMVCSSAVAAENPFSEIPKGHWAYDAVQQLAAHGIVSGYDRNDFAGKRLITRYEMASIAARAMAKLDQEKASSSDIEILKKLILEYKNEFEVLGVKVANLEKSVTVMNDYMGGWRITGSFYFDALLDNEGYSYNGADKEFRKERLNLNLRKRLGANTYFHARYRTGAYSDADGDAHGMGDTNAGEWHRIYIETRLGGRNGIGLRVGRFSYDWEEDYGLKDDVYPMYGYFRGDGFMLWKDWQRVSLSGVVLRNVNYDSTMAYSTSAMTMEDKIGYYMHYAIDASYRINNKWFVGASGYRFDGDIDVYSDGSGAQDVTTVGAYSGYDITPNISLKGIYYHQSRSDPSSAQNLNSEVETSSDAWKVILGIKQAALRFTSLWVEYAEQDNLFRTVKRYHRDFSTNPKIMDNRPRNAEKTKFVYITADQKWNDKWSTFFRFANANYGTSGYADASNFAFGLRYHYTPSLSFLLIYDITDFGESTASGASYYGTDHVLLFRTLVTF